MKQKDIIIIIIVVFMSGILSFFVSNALFASPDDLQTEVEVVEPITTDFPELDSRYFNNRSVDPTEVIVIGDDQNTAPFNQSND